MSTGSNVSTLALKAEIALLRLEVDRLSTEHDTTPGGRVATTAGGDFDPPSGAGGNVYVFDDDDAEARAFDEFYRAYDEVHAKTREFLLD